MYTHFMTVKSMKVMMSNEQIDGIEKYLSKDDIMLEYGSGGSTLHFSQFVDKYYSIEHDKNWYRDVKLKIFTDSIIYNHVNPNYDGEDMGSIYAKQQLSIEERESILNQYPLCEENDTYSCIGRYSQFSNYINYIDNLNVKYFNKVLIDGRSRTVCAYKILPFIDSDSLVFIDDFYRLSYGNTTRGDIEFGEQFFTAYEKVERIDTLLVARKK